MNEKSSFQTLENSVFVQKTRIGTVTPELAGKLIIEEFKGKPSVREIKVQCFNCSKTAIRLLTWELLSTTAIQGLWIDGDRQISMSSSCGLASTRFRSHTLPLITHN